VNVITGEDMLHIFEFPGSKPELETSYHGGCNVLLGLTIKMLGLYLKIDRLLSDS
jgi:hypothetical protein